MDYCESCLSERQEARDWRSKPYIGHKTLEMPAPSYMQEPGRLASDPDGGSQFEETQPMENYSRELTTGEKFMGVDFNPSGNEEVSQIKALLAAVADIILDTKVVAGGFKDELSRKALLDLLAAQMMAVKLVTFNEDRFIPRG